MALLTTDVVVDLMKGQKRLDLAQDLCIVVLPHEDGDEDNRRWEIGVSNV